MEHNDDILFRLTRSEDYNDVLNAFDAIKQNKIWTPEILQALSNVLQDFPNHLSFSGGDHDSRILRYLEGIYLYNVNLFLYVT